MRTLLNHLQGRTSNSPLVVFRILFGLIMAVECWGAIGTGLVDDVFVNTPFNFTFIGFEWLSVLHGPGMRWYYAAMGFVAIMVAAGFLYRGSSVLLALLWSCAYFAEKTHYNNHYYLMVLLCWIMALMPAARRASVDARLRPGIKTATCYRWQIMLFQAQIAIVYVFAAIAKMNPDWLHAMPLNIWMRGKADIPLIGGLLQQPAAPWIISYAGLLFDLSIVPLFLWRRTRLPALGLSILFHVGNSVIFQIGTFPYLALALDVFFFPARNFDRLLPRYAPGPTAALATTYGWKLAVFGGYLLWQMFLPIRHLFMNGDVAWTEEGHRMAWRMMLRAKSGTVSFLVRDGAGHEWTEWPYSHVSGEQAAAIAEHPDFCWQFVQYLKRLYARKGMEGVQIYAKGTAAVNGGQSARLYDDATDLAKVKWEMFGRNNWVTDRPASAYGFPAPPLAP